MIIGFTGTRVGMTPAQKATIVQLLAKHKPREVHHGDCIGADEEFHGLCIESGRTIRIIAHPPANSSMRAYVLGADETRPVRDYLERDRNIAEVCELLIGAPKSLELRNNSGTWYTINHAYKLGRRVQIVAPDGAVIERAADLDDPFLR